VSWPPTGHGTNFSHVKITFTLYNLFIRPPSGEIEHAACIANATHKSADHCLHFGKGKDSCWSSILSINHKIQNSFVVNYRKLFLVPLSGSLGILPWVFM
jgi:hypothetical protein